MAGYAKTQRFSITYSHPRVVFCYLIFNKVKFSVADKIPSTIWIRKGDVSDLEMFHECMHFEDFLRRGKKAYTRGHPREILSVGNLPAIPKRDELISTFIKENMCLIKF